MELFIGRLHPLMVHFPIGLLVVAFIMEMLTVGGKRAGLRPGISWMVSLGAAFAVISAILGWFLSNADSYSGDVVQSHRNWGIITAVLAIGSAWLLQLTLKGKLSSLVAYRSILAVTVGFLTVASHLGASLTHGEGFLTEAFEQDHQNQDHQGSQELLAELNQLSAYSETHLERLNLEVRAIFARNCYQCHSENKKKGDLVLEHKRGVFKGGESGSIIAAGSSSQSELYRRVSLPADHDEVMPKKGKVLKAHQIELIKLWIDEGAYWADRALEVFPEAPLALTKPPLPDDRQYDNAIDAFTNVYFEKNGVNWPQVVDDQIFIRRAYLDIIGLLPSPEQITTFRGDQDYKKREKLIDELLSDHHNYTQHWLTFWNDLLRNDYSGTGFITGGRKQITNWLYQSLLENKPYNLMVKELVNPDKSSEGFIKGIKWRGVVNASQSTEMQAAQNISQSLMGMNLKCASCHNSFVSNLTLEQAYGFASIFADSALELNRCDQPLGRMAKPEFLYTELGTVEADSIKARLLKLSEIIVKPENGRLYRTIANRIWRQLLGRGLVEPVDEMDQPAWDAALLDWLAADFIESGYDLKHLMRSILTSKTYQLPAVGYQDIAEITANDYIFRGPVIRRLSAEQFTDALSQVAAPVYYATAYSPESEDLPTNRIWHREVKFDRDVLPDPGDRYFRYLFNIEDYQAVDSAQLLLSVDHSFELFLNGKKVGEGDDWRKVLKLEVSGLLKAGDNLIAIKGNNEGTIANPAGILMALKIGRRNGSLQLVTSNTDWKSTAESPSIGWNTLEYDDSKWAKVKSYGSKHWDHLVTMTFHEVTQPFARASLVRQHPFMKALGRPTRENVATTRADRATLLQALELTNGEYFNNVLMEGAERWISEHGDNTENIAHSLYEKAYGRAPNNQELKTLAGTIGETADQESVQDLLWATVLSPEFQFIY